MVHPSVVLLRELGAVAMEEAILQTNLEVQWAETPILEAPLALAPVLVLPDSRHLWPSLRSPWEALP